MFILWKIFIIDQQMKTHVGACSMPARSGFLCPIFDGLVLVEKGKETRRKSFQFRLTHKFHCLGQAVFSSIISRETAQKTSLFIVSLL